jgi:ATP-dependent DNA helicase DinG
MKLISKKEVGLKHTYDLNVEDNHNFIISNAVVHNCGSYELGKRILMNSRNTQRLYSYTNSKEKEQAIQGMNLLKNAVIIGPSLTEGLNLEDDMSRFQIIMKVPYPSLTDELVKARMERNDEWYAWATSLAIMQAIGRSIRNQNDYATTYILDACFLDLNKKVKWPKWFENRFKFI